MPDIEVLGGNGGPPSITLIRQVIELGKNVLQIRNNLLTIVLTFHLVALALLAGCISAGICEARSKIVVTVRGALAG